MIPGISRQPLDIREGGSDPVNAPGFDDACRMVEGQPAAVVDLYERFDGVAFQKMEFSAVQSLLFIQRSEGLRPA